ncbi:protein of unknown function [Dyadobacter sp. SG02]|uniref:eCIS core domain-containing protein n=1 Tax=Dyadobacter sp. SG02 TaxID=1855291 RepID=UPI0008B9111A|nr:DUF4157 domain-containing protein [Dyadobacter sp. SG02]SEI51227.1 protein of unknown function [Dyadobacter sp. SG02]
MLTAVKSPVADKKQAAKAPFFQPKLTVNEPGDSYEQEADAVADRVMRVPDPTAHNSQFKKVPVASLQRQCASCEEEKIQRKESEEEETPVQLKPISELSVQRKCAECNEEEKVQRKELVQRDDQETPVATPALLPPLSLPRPTLFPRVQPGYLAPLPAPTLQIDWFGINTMLQSRGASHLGPYIRNDVEVLWRSNFRFFRNIMPESTALWATNKSISLSVGNYLSRDFPTQSELFERGLPPGTFKTPIIPVLWGSFDLGSGTPPRLFRKEQSPESPKQNTAPPIVSDVISGSGRPLDADTRHFMEARIGHSFESVQLHTDTQAASSADSINARAYTSGNHIVFNENQYQPQTDTGKRLLAHELVHTIQQDGGIVRRIADKASSVCDAPQETIKAVTGPEKVTDIPGNNPSKTSPQPKAPANAEPAADPKAANAPAAKPEAITSPAQDTSFKTVLADTRRAKKSQGHHKKEDVIADEASQSAANPAGKDAQMGQANKVLGTEEKLAAAPAFSKEMFKATIKKRVNEGLPKNEDDNKGFKQGGVQSLTSSVGQEVVSPQDPTLATLKNTENATVGSAGALYQKEVGVTQPEDPGRKAKIGQSERAVPKPLPQEFMKLDEEHDADSLDRAMDDPKLAEYNVKLTNDHLASSEEPEFKKLDSDGQATKALETKQGAQTELCQISSKNREAEYTAHQEEADAAQSSLNKTMVGKFGARKDSFDKVNKNKDEASRQDEAILKAYYDKIAGIYTTSKEAVDTKLKELDAVTELFSTAMTKANDTFSSRVTSRLNDYYGVGVFNLSEEDEDAFERSAKEGIKGQIHWLNVRRQMTTDPVQIAYIDERIRYLTGRGNAIETIPERVFREEKATFIAALDESLDQIGTIIETTLNAARDIIKKGKEDIDCASHCVPAHLQDQARENTDEFKAKFDDLDTALTDKQKDIEESLSREYVKNVSALKETFEKIRAEAAMPWWQKAWNAIKKVATILYDLGKLLLNVLAKAAGVIGDIIAHPLRFIGNLFKAVGKGFDMFVGRIGEHLEKIILRLVLGMLPPGIRLPDTFDAAGIFSLALDVLGLSKDKIRERAVDKLGEPVVHALEETFDLFIIFKKEGFAGLWKHIKDRIGDLKDQVIGQVKDYLSESIIKAAIKYLLSALTPVSGFIKACETIINMAIFFIENLKNLLQLLDAILDSFIDVAQGKIENAAAKVESALQDILLIGIKFLAALIGIKFDVISAKIGKLFAAIKTPIDRAINWLFDKAKAFAEKTGLTALAKKGKAAVEKGKEQLVEKGGAAVGKILGFFGIKSTFKDEKGKTHSVAFEDKNNHIKLIVRSEPLSIEEFIKFYETEYAQSLKDKTNKGHFDNIKTTLLPQMNQKVKDIEKPNNKKVQADKERLLEIKVDIARSLGLLMKGNKKVGHSFESYYLEGMVGQYGKMANSRGDILEGDHQPQTALLKWSTKYLKKSKIDDWIGSGHGSNAYVILLHKRRHKLGATHSTFDQPDETAIKAAPDLEQKRKLVLAILKKALKHDATEMLKIYQASDKDDAAWGDIWHDTEGDDKEKKALIAKIKANVKAGEASIQAQPLHTLIE